MSAASETTARKNSPLLPVLGHEMTRCECAELDFTEIARRAAAGGTSPEAVMTAAGVGQTCTACAQDLHAFLARRAQSPE